MEGRGDLGPMTTYGRTPYAVCRWPDDPAARRALEEYLQALPPDSRDVMTALDGSDLRFAGVDLSGLDLCGAGFFDADLSGVRLADADLYGAWLMGATLHGVDLSRADLRKAKARGCDAQDAILYEADLRKAEFDDADLRRADLRKSLLHRTFLSGADLRDCAFGDDKSSTFLGDTRLAGCRLDGATGLVTGPVDVGADSPRRLDGPDLQRWFADNGATNVEIRQSAAH